MIEPDLFSDIPDDPVADNEIEIEKESRARCLKIKEMSKNLKTLKYEEIPYTSKRNQSVD